jgi:hypothetical protein
MIVKGHTNVFTCIYGYWAQVLVGLGYDDVLVLSKGVKDSSLVYGDVGLSSTWLDVTTYSIGKIRDTFYNEIGDGVGHPFAADTQFVDFFFFFSGEICIEIHVLKVARYTLV